MSLTLTSAPVLEPVTLVETKNHLRIDGSAEDAFVTSLITTSRLQVEAMLGIALIAQGWVWRLDDWPRRIALPLRPVITIDQVRVQSADLGYTIIPSSQYLLDGDGLPPRLVPRGIGLPAPRVPALGCEIAFTAGFGTVAADVPAPLRHAILLLVAHWYENREPLISGVGATAIPDAVIALLEPYRQVRL